MCFVKINALFLTILKHYLIDISGLTSQMWNEYCSSRSSFTVFIYIWMAHVKSPGSLTTTKNSPLALKGSDIYCASPSSEEVCFLMLLTSESISNM